MLHYVHSLIAVCLLFDAEQIVYSFVFFFYLFFYSERNCYLVYSGKSLINIGSHGWQSSGLVFL